MNAVPSLFGRLRRLRIVDDAAEQALVRDDVLTLADLELAVIEERAVAADPRLRRAAGALAQEARPVMLGRAWDILDSLIASLRHHCRGLDAIEASAAVRRAEPLVRDLVVVAQAEDPAAAIDAIATLPTIADVLHRGPRRLVVLFEGSEVDVRVSTPGDYGTVLFSTTGPPAHAAEVFNRGTRQACASERDVYAQAGLAWLPPETRDGPGAIDHAMRGDVPRLIERADIRGDLHMHSTYSDGRDSLPRMIEATHALGYEYIAITDHSEHAAAARTLTLDQLARQRDEIARLRETAPGMTILHGLEVDIMPDGTLDWPDAVLETLDIVLASLHDSGGHDGARLTRRCMAAIRHPLVSVITHPANQLVGRRAGYDLDYDAIYEAAAESGTALEIDGAPSHLDLSGERAGEAVRAGATVVIDSDCHRAVALDRQMQMGVGTARRGWVEPAHVLNARPLDAVLAFVARKRAR
ncbi:MAG: PHP domain-containing protein [Vicinamibacterales bacterium]